MKKNHNNQVYCTHKTVTPAGRLAGMVVKNLWIAVCAATILLTACGGGSSSSSQNSGPLAGNWQLTLQSPADQSFVGVAGCAGTNATDPLCMGGFLQQSNSAVNGQFVYAVATPGSAGTTNTCSSGSGVVTGSVSGQNVTLSVAAGGQAFSLTGTLSADGSSISGTYSSTDGPTLNGNKCGTAQTNLAWSASLVPAINGQVQGFFHSRTNANNTIDQDFPITGFLQQGPNVGASNATVSGTLNIQNYPCLSTAYVNGEISGSSLLLQIFGPSGLDVGTIGTSTIAPSASGYPKLVQLHSTQAGLYLQARGICPVR